MAKTEAYSGAASSNTKPRNRDGGREGARLITSRKISRSQRHISESGVVKVNRAQTLQPYPSLQNEVNACKSIRCIGLPRRRLSDELKSSCFACLLADTAACSVA